MYLTSYSILIHWPTFFSSTNRRLVRIHWCSIVFSLQGATIKRHEITGDILVARVIHGGLVERSGELG
jgi:hypothetical protein